MYKQQQPDFLYTIYICLLSTCVQSFNFLDLTVPEKNVTKKNNVWKLERKNNEEIKGRIRSSSPILVYTIHLPTVHVCTKFLLGLTVPEKSVTKNVNVWKLKRKKWRNKGTNKQQQPDSGIHDTSAHCPRCVPSFNRLGLTVPEKSVTKNFHFKGYGMTESQNDRITKW